MRTPIFDFVKRYAESGRLKLHMPGHKGVGRLGCEALDITEIEGADSLYECAGIIAESERNVSELFGFGHTYYSTEGSTQCIKAMLYLAMIDGARRGNKSRSVIAPRNAHRAFINASALLDLEPEWIYPDKGRETLLSAKVTAGEIKDALERAGKAPLAVYLTSPDYLGYMPDIAAIAAVCRAYGLPLLVDNAHGAYLKFLPESIHPIDLGAMMSCDSAHKTLPVLTGGAYLQLSSELPESVAASAKGALALFGSTSPSYLTLQSLDLCNAYLADNYRKRLGEYIGIIEEAKLRLCLSGWDIPMSDPLRIVVRTAGRGYTGREVAELLRRQGIECEFADLYSVVLMATPDNPPSDIDRLCDALRAMPEREALDVCETDLPRPERVMTPREAMLLPREIIRADMAAGRICALSALSCPPAVPLAVAGEVISPECAALLGEYGIEFLEVVAEK